MGLISQKIIESKSNLQKSYFENAMHRDGAIAALKRIKKHGLTESEEKINWSKWFEQQVRLTADKRVRLVITTGASQISKSLGNYLVAIDDLINGQINIAWCYASRSSMQNQQPSQFQAMITAWLLSQSVTFRIQRDAITRYKIGKAIANFTYANSVNETKSGGAAEGKEQNSFQASALYLEEKSSHGSTDLSPRLGASLIASKPIRELGTPGNGNGIEKSLKACQHNFEPGLICPKCDRVSTLHPLGNLFKKNRLTNNYFDTRGHIQDYYKNDKGEPIIVCNHCNADLTLVIADIDKIEFYSLQTWKTIDQFLDDIPNEIYYQSVSIYLSPLLRCASDPYRLKDLVEDGKNPESVLIFHQNKLGLESKFTLNGIGFDDFNHAKNIPWQLKKPKRYVGIDQGTDTHYLVDLEVLGDQVNLMNAIAIRESDIIAYLKYHKIDFALMDGEPGRMSANVLSKQSGGKLAIADQREIATDFAPIKVKYGGEEIDCYAINNNLYQEKVIYDFIEQKVRFKCDPHEKFKSHITAVKRDISTGKFLRPANHQDDFFYSYLFAKAAIDIAPKKAIATSANVRSPLKIFKY